MAPEQYKFELQTKVPKGIKLTKEQKLVLKKVAEALFEKDFTEQSLHDEFYNLSKEAGLEPKEFFKAAYNVLIKKERGPKLANFILTIGKEKVAKMFDEIK